MHKQKSLHILLTCGIAALLVLIIPYSAFTQTAAKKLTIERIFDPDKPSLSGELPSNISWMPDGKSFIYALQDKEDNDYDLWQFDCETGKAAILLDNDTIQKMYETIARNKEEEGRELSLEDYILSPDGKHLLFSNDEDLYNFNLETKKILQLIHDEEEEQNPAFSPDSQYIAYTKNNNLYTLEISSSVETQLTTDGGGNILNGYLTWVYFEELYGRSYKGFWWSPDSKHIAYYRFDESPVFKMPMVDHIPFEAEVIPVTYPKSGGVNPLVKLGVVSIETKEIRWMDIPAEEEIYIARAIWLPDGTQLSLQILNRDQNKLQLFFAYPASGKTELVMTEEQKSWVTQTDDIHFMQNKKGYIWSTDKDGRNHLYLYDIQGNLISQLTKGKWRVSGLVKVDEDNDWIYFTANEKSTLESHLYKIKIDGSGFQQISKEEGWHFINMSPSSKLYIDRYSNITRPSMMNLYHADGTKLYTIEENVVEELTEYPMSTPEFFTFLAEDGLELPAMIIKPINFNAEKKYPVLVSIYGGPESQRVANRWLGDIGLWYQILAEKGFIILRLDNRFSTHFGKEGSAKLHRNLGNWEIKDQVSGVKYLRALPYVDSNRIGIWGWSYGGYNTIMTMLKAADYFQVGVSVAPVTDFRDYDTIYTERYMDTPQDNPEGYKNGSALEIADQLKGKLLIIHGTMDDNVHFQNVVQIANEFIKHGKQFDFMLYPRCEHSINIEKARVHLFTLITNYLITHLTP